MRCMYLRRIKCPSQIQIFMIELHPLINLGTFPIFNLLVAIGLICSIILYYYNSHNIDDRNYKKEDIIIYLGLSFLVGIFFSNIGNWYIFPEYTNLPLFQKIKHAGYTFYFGLIGFIVSILILMKLAGYAYNIYLNEIVPSITMFHLFGRIGCLLGGCCYGNLCDFSIMSFHIHRFPVREFEILYLLILTILFQTILKKNRLIIYLLFYSLFRFFIEFKRGDARGHLFSNILSPSQEISLIIIVFLLIYLIFKIIFLKPNTLKAT